MIKLSKENKVIKASYQGCHISDRNLFKTSRCIIPISIGQPVHEGEKFKATVNLINRTFKECIILVDDVVQRHTLKIEDMISDTKTLYNKSIKEGKLWLERNEEIYSLFKIPNKIITWAKFIEHPNYPEIYKKIESEYNNNHLYKKAIHNNIKEFLARKKKQTINGLLCYA